LLQQLKKSHPLPPSWNVRKADRRHFGAQASQALTVFVAGERLAIPANDVAEVIRNPAVTRIPLSPPGLLGVANLRGTVIPVVSLASLLGRDSAEISSRRVVVVGEGQPIGLTVGDVASLERSDRLKSGKNPVRFLDVAALMSEHFGALSKPAIRGTGTVTQASKVGPSSTTPTDSFFSFGIAGQEFALPLESVHEVLGLPNIVAAMPRTDDAMLGAITLRNRLLPLISLATLLGLDGAGSAAKIVVASIGGVRVGLVVDSLNAIVRASRDQIDPVPLVLTRGRQEAHIQAICRIEGGRRLMSILSTDHLLEEGLTERLAAQGGNEDELMADRVGHSETEQFVVFQLADECYGLPIASVVEVVAPPEKLTKLPKAPKFVDGVMNLRGQVVPVIDQRRRFEVVSSSSPRKARIIVVRVGQGLAGFVVDGVSEVLRVNADQLRASPELTSKQSGVIDRIANLELDGRMVLLVDPEELLNRAEQDMISAMHGKTSANT
jgi:purine-binding chemotaxis protein CheW